jgi:formate hydrogenlyase subunit 3/multisubunit Na+/H+ antiporter MnhD subunit
MSWSDQIGFPVLSVITFLPLAAVLLILLFGRGKPQVYKVISLVATLAAFALSAWTLFAFKPKLPGMQFAENVTWIEAFNIKYGMGVDGIALLLVFLTTLLGAIVIIASWNYVKDREMGFFISLLLLEVGMVGVFCATDLFLFYVFWEAMLIPMYFIIGIWGGPRRIYAAIKFFLFTLIGSLLMLVAIIVVVYAFRDATGAISFDIQELSKAIYAYHLQFWAFLAFFVAFAIKVPMFPVHTWLPDAHVEAPTAGSVILAGVLLKMGGYGMLRFCLPFFPDAAVTFGGRHRVRGARVADAEGPQEARRLLQREPHGLRDRRHLRRHRTRGQRRRHGGRHPRHAQSRLPHGRPLPHGRVHLRAHAHAPDRRHELARQAAPDRRRLPALLRLRVAGPARAERLRG